MSELTRVFQTCAAQNCGGHANWWDGPPFCADCLSLLPETWVRRLKAEWNAPVMEEIEEEEWRSFVGRHSGKKREINTGVFRKRLVYSVGGMAAQNRRIEVETAWILRRIKRHVTEGKD